jgi:hypothetical protein
MQQGSAGSDAAATEDVPTEGMDDVHPSSEGDNAHLMVLKMGRTQHELAEAVDDTVVAENVPT